MKSIESRAGSFRSGINNAVFKAREKVAIVLAGGKANLYAGHLADMYFEGKIGMQEATYTVYRMESDKELGFKPWELKNAFDKEVNYRKE